MPGALPQGWATMTAPSHAIPAARREIEAALLAHLAKSGQDETARARFAALARLLSARFHLQFHAELELLKESYHAFDPDHVLSRREAQEADEAHGERFVEALGRVLSKGNYRLLSQDDIDYALRSRTLFPIDAEVDFELFDHLQVWARGVSRASEELKGLFGLRRRRVDFEMYDRVCICLRLRRALEPKRLSQDCVPGKIVLKLFRNIPRADLEMLFPNTRLKMRFIDKLFIGVPALVGGVPVAAKLAPAVVALAVLVGFQRGHIDQLSIIAGLSGLFGLGLFLFRQWDKFKSRKLLFMKMLSENLYFRNLDNNEGVLTRLVDEAEEEECKEALIAYALLLLEPGIDEAALDARAEAWLKDELGLEVDFEVDDALAKLERLGIVRRDDGGGLTVEPPARALEIVGARWDPLAGFGEN